MENDWRNQNGEMTLTEIRKEIDRVDSGLRELFLERMMLVDQVARLKAKNREERAVYRPDREAEILNRLTEGVDPDYKEEYIALIRKILEISRLYQEEKIPLYSSEIPD